MTAELPEPDWANLEGGSDEAKWDADRFRKLGLASELLARMREEVLPVIDDAEAHYDCRADLLQQQPHAIDWYISLAGFSLKSFRNARESPRLHGMTRSPETVRKALLEGRDMAENELLALVAWLNDEIEKAHPLATRSREAAMSTVFAFLGGRVIGQSQNIGGSDAVLLLRTQLVHAIEARGIAIEIEGEEGWVPYSSEENVLLRQRLRVCGMIIFQFNSGGNIPDLVVGIPELDPIFVSEVKGRIDTANVWESWMPQVVDHMKTWSKEYRHSRRLFFGTVITGPMIEGGPPAGTERVGLRSLHDQGALDSVYNISKLAGGDPQSVATFDQLIDYVLKYCG